MREGRLLRSRSRSGRRAWRRCLLSNRLLRRGLLGGRHLLRGERSLPGDRLGGFLRGYALYCGTPEAALTTYLVFFLNKPDRMSSIIAATATTVLFTAVVGLLLL